MSIAVAARFSGDRLPVEVTTYVGRGNEIREVKRLLGIAPLVTLTGPGGVGKTRLAMRVATSTRASFDDVVFVGLADLHDPKLLVNTVADRLGLGDRSTRAPIDLVVDYLRARRLLLVLDNCEHLIEASAHFAQAILTSCPDVVILATSRQSLGVAGEHVMPVPPLAVPDLGESAAAVHQYDAVRLFLDRATAVVPSFTITDDDVDAVIQLCRSLDGLPLAFELAAVRLRSLSVRQLADRLSKRFTLLTRTNRSAPSRHETLEALIDWSHQLCTEQERLLWARAAVFPGGFDLEAAEAVCCGDDLTCDDLLDMLDSLIDKSILLREEHDGQVRFRMLETVRQYGEDRLRADGDLTGLRRRHRDWCREVTRDFGAKWIGPGQLALVQMIDREHANLRQAFDFCLSDPDEAVTGLRMVTEIRDYWLIRGLTEGRIWAGRLLAVAVPDTSEWAGAAWVEAFLALVQGDMDAYAARLAEASEVAERIDDASARAYVDHVRGYAALMANEGEQSAELFRKASNAFIAHGDLSGELWSTFNYGLAMSLAGDLETGRTVMRACADRCASLGEAVFRCWALWSLSAAEYLHGEYERSLEAGLEVLRLQREVVHRVILGFSLNVLAGCAAHRGEHRRAARLLGASVTVFQMVGASPTNYAAFGEPMRRDMELVTGVLGIEAAGAEFMVGAKLPTDTAVSYALGEDITRAVPESDESRLTKREREVAELVAKGMTNKEIAKALVISLRTAETHIDHIRTKLGFSNRAQIAAWISRVQRSGQ
ncbi:ATP-binding protein [Actinokineospora xionganensis]|uniref:LuxR family transcriptional regulator n=1 Tax=Actinokineospora xionganensis TaxID=2684470 RepID=A0ABR7L9N9_9PSEU|nr:LuxR C-terminal-related transcriptional regulator [Actinokineospora xionganensis]MBC6449398.1 LuxR family transcriptional regulator [Actinokineospora xionganensis]